MTSQGLLKVKKFVNFHHQQKIIDEVGTMVTTSDKKLLIAAGAHLIKVFDLETKQQVHIFKNPFGSIEIPFFNH